MPLRQNRPELQQQYQTLLLQSANFEFVSIDTALAQTGASLRAKFNIRLPDALQIAAAMTTGCEAFLTNDDGLKRVTGIRVLVVSELEI